MICTDVAARGIDINGLPYVINVTLPDEKQNYIHRIGRVGRADRMGLAISLVCIFKKIWGLFTLEFFTTLKIKLIRKKDLKSLRSIIPWQNKEVWKKY